MTPVRSCLPRARASSCPPVLLGRSRIPSPPLRPVVPSCPALPRPAPVLSRPAPPVSARPFRPSSRFSPASLPLFPALPVLSCPVPSGPALSDPVCPPPPPPPPPFLPPPPPPPPPHFPPRLALPPLPRQPRPAGLVCSACLPRPPLRFPPASPPLFPSFPLFSPFHFGALFRPDINLIHDSVTRCRCRSPIFAGV